MKNILFLGVVLLGVGFAVGAAGQGNVTASWVADVEGIAPGQPFTLGLKLEHRDHWHTYWKNPGDSGLPTAVAWEVPEGFSVSEPSWPVPEWLNMLGEVIFGYEGTVILPFTVTPPPGLEPGTTVRLGGRVSWLECADVCIPGSAEIFLRLPVGEQARPAGAAVLRELESFRSGIPQAAEFPVTARAEGESVVFGFQPPGPGKPVQFFPADEYVFALGGGLPLEALEQGFQVKAPLLPGGEALPEQLRGLLVMEEEGGGRRGYDFAVELGAAGLSDAVTPVPTISLPSALLGALLGGLILNLMPCVFPVISLKILGFVNLAGSEPRKVWHHGLVFSSGVLLSFWALGAMLLIVKAVSPSVGWGFQLKEPGFVVAICLLFFLLSLNLFGLFELGTSLTAVGSSSTTKEGWSGSFFSGVLATIVATPCTAPFMGAAIGLALTQSAAVAMSIFTAVGVGMCLPYLLLSRFPQWLKLLPRPGPWMESLKQGMGFLILAFALYLVWVFAGLRGTEGLARLLTGLLGCGVAAWIFGRWGSFARPARTRRVATVLAVLLVAAGGVFAAKQSPESQWVAYTPELVAQLEAEQRPYFIDFTASWCVTCQANKKIALRTEEVQAAFQKKGVTLIAADWTRQQEPITSALAAFGRSGVPLYVLHPGEGGESRLLPEVLNKGIVLKALDEL